MQTLPTGPLPHVRHIGRGTEVRVCRQVRIVMGNKLNRWCASVSLVAAIACGGGNKGTATSPSPTPTTPTTFAVSGTVIDGTTSTPIAGAAVSINARYRATTDSSGRYRVTGLLDAGPNPNVTSVSADNYASDVRSIQGTSETVRLHHRADSGGRLDSRHRCGG